MPDFKLVSLQVKNELPDLLYIIVYDDIVTDEQRALGVLDWDTFMKVRILITEVLGA